VKLVTTTKMKVAEVRGELKTIGTVGLQHICYATRTTTLRWQTDRFIQTASCEAVLSNKFWNKKIHGSVATFFLHTSVICAKMFCLVFGLDMFDFHRKDSSHRSVKCTWCLFMWDKRTCIPTCFVQS